MGEKSELEYCQKLKHVVDPSLEHNGLFLADLPCVHWIEYVKDLEAQVKTVREMADGFSADFAASCPQAARKFAVLASRSEASDDND